MTRILVSLALLALTGSGCVWIHPTEPARPLPAELAQARFQEVAVPFAHRWDRKTSHHLTGAAALDLDGDGRQEIFAGGGAGQPDALLALEGDRLVDRIAGTGLSSLEATYGSCALDLDGDGDTDLVVARNDGVTLYRNEGGRFRGERLPVALPENAVALAVSAADVERDGDVDLYVSVFVDFPHFVPATFNVPAHAKANRLLRNEGGLRFVDATSPALATQQNTFTSLFVDLDGDGFQDLVVAQNTGQVELLRNTRDGGFDRIHFDSGYGFWMGVAAGDVDADGDQDLAFTNVGDTFPGFVVNGDRHDDQPAANGWKLWRNDGGFRFADVTHEAGLDDLGFAWGTVFEDMNLDGRLDLLAAQNYVKWPVHGWFKFPGKLLLATGEGLDFRSSAAAENPAYGNTPVIADLDGDARPDLFWLNNDGPSRAYLNRSAGNAVVVRLPDAVSSLGARVRVEGGAAAYTREVTSASGLGGDPTGDLVFGLGEAKRAERVVITWPGGATTVIEDPPTNAAVLVTAPAGLASR